LAIKDTISHTKYTPKVIQFTVFMPTETKPVQLKRDKCKVVPGMTDICSYLLM